MLSYVIARRFISSQLFSRAIYAYQAGQMPVLLVFTSVYYTYTKAFALFDMPCERARPAFIVATLTISVTA